MKKILTYLLILLLSFAFFSCSDPSGGGNSDSLVNKLNIDGDNTDGETGQSFTVKYVLNGGTNNPANPSVYTIEDESGTIPLNAPEKTKEETGKYLPNGTLQLSSTTYAFGGWYKEYKDNAFTTQVTELSLSLGTVTLYAKWSTSTSVIASNMNYLRIDADGTPNESGEYILFGEYPQTKVTDEALISDLGGYDSDTWTSYGYYISGAISDFMKYTDKEYDGDRYRGVYFTGFRPYWCNYTSSAGNSYQDENDYKTFKVYWFKYEPIKWRILNEADGTALILSEVAIDSQQWDYEAGDNYKNNYKESTIRKWLNETFYDTAFSDMQKALIQTTTVDNSVSSTGYNSNLYACADTEDNIFLLSYKEATNTDYGMGENTARVKKSTDYAKSQGCRKEPDGDYKDNCYWWLRSPYSDYDYYARDVYDDGHFDYNRLYFTSRGIVPALTISY